ncbi:MAG: hypothetical protein IE926_04510 [Micrococcales bacterium]|nr:hypothetical protein [Micrococcales bacterium]
MTTPDLSELLARQDLLATRSQLVRAGVTASTIRWNAGRSWRVVLPRVYLLSREQPTPRQRLRAGLLWTGPGAALAGRTAARLHGLGSLAEQDSVELLVPAPRRSRVAGFATARRTLLDDRPVERDGLLMSSVARSVVDAARAARSPRDREALFIEAVQRRLTTLDTLAEWVYRLRPRDAAPVLVALQAAGSGAWSVPEHDLLDLMRTSSVLPDAWPNPELHDARGVRLTTPDAWLDDVAMAVMVHSRRHHANGDDWDATVSSDADLVAAGAVVVGVTPRQIRSDGRAVLARIEQAWSSAGRRPRPPLTASRATTQYWS